MPGANRYALSNQLFHVTHPCHNRSFLLKLAKDRNDYRRCAIEMSRSHRIAVLNYCLTSNHIHMLCEAIDKEAISRFAFSAIIIISRLKPQKVISGNLSDTVQGRRNYLQHLSWLQSDGKAKRQVHSSKLCHGWALGSKQFKEELVDQFLPVGQVGHLKGKDLAEANEIRWGRILAKCMAVMEKDSRDIHTDKKSVHWKVLIALFMKDNTSVSNVWLTNHLNMGIPQGVSRSTRKLADRKNRKHKKYLEMSRITA